MNGNIRLSTENMVIWVLREQRPTFCSIKEIKEKIFERFQYSIEYKSIVKALDHSQYVSKNILENSERRGLLRQPTKVFSVIIPIEITNPIELIQNETK